MDVGGGSALASDHAHPGAFDAKQLYRWLGYRAVAPPPHLKVIY